MISVTALFKAVQADILGEYPDLRSSALEMGSGDANRVAHAFMLESFLKKQQMVIPKEADDAALETFLRVNEAVGAYSRRPCHEWEEELYGCFKRHVYNFFYPRGLPLLLGWNQIVSLGDLGKGSNLGAPATDFYTKMFCSSMTVSQAGLYNLYRHCIDGNAPTWRQAEETRLSQGYAVEVVNANKLSFVAKNDRTSRTICTEPTLNMFLQRGISNVVESRLRDYGIDLTKQPDHNRELARRGSISGDFSTIDLSSASDSISLNGVRDWIPQQQLSYFLAVRSRATKLPDGRVIELEMLSTMGNGYTFSLQTALFMCVILAAFEMAGVKPIIDKGGPHKNWGVFGDDIIVPNGKVTRLTLTLLGLLGFSVNAEKTFVEGPFRESCGGDFYRGTNVRPAYAKRWSTQDELYTTYNRLDWWCGNHGELKRTRSLLIKGIGKRPHFVPAHFPDNTGVQIPYSLARRLLRKDRNGSILTKCLMPKTSGLKVTWGDEETLVNTGSVVHPQRKKNAGGQWNYNSAGLLLVILRGSCKALKDSMVIPFRTDGEARYATRGATVPVWDDPVAKREFGYFPRIWLIPSSNF